MTSERLLERRKWFRVFPEGTLEFTIITRVLALMMLMALAIVGGSQRPFVVTALIVILWVDYALLIWWVVQVACDLRLVSGELIDPRRQTRAGITALLPSVAAAVALIPWAGVAKFAGISMGFVPVWLPAVAAILYLLLLLPAYRALHRASVDSRLWTFLLLIPLVHWFALHRIVARLGFRIQQGLRERGESSQAVGASAALTIADFTWVFSMLPWVVVAGMSLLRGWPAGGMSKFGPVCGTILAAVFAIANLAALEGVQRQMVALLRKP
jgi:hypothetical protein